MSIKKSLGKGLGALFGDNSFDDEMLLGDAVELDEYDVLVKNNSQVASENTKPSELPIERIDRNEEQPRKVFDANAMSELISSIKTHGVITPIIVVKIGERYMIIAGERRWRAAKAAGLKTIPAIVRNYSTKQIKEISLIENIQREDLNPIETAEAIKQLMQEYDYTQEQVAERLGKSRSAVANTVGLLTLDKRVIDMVSSGRLSVGHAKMLHAMSDPDTQLELALKAVDGKMTVRRFEELIKTKKSVEEAYPKVRPEMSIELRDLIGRMQRVLATKVSAFGNDFKGRIYIDYYTPDDLERIYNLINYAEERIESQ